MLKRLLNRGYRFWSLLCALMVLLVNFTYPTFALKTHVFHYVFVIDITRSMNARDYHVAGMPADRLSFAKEALRYAMRDLPCGSTVGLGVFTTKNIMLLFNPLEICDHFAVIDDAIAHIDWRMAWAADSNIERGLYASIRAIKKLDGPSRLVFLTDGEQTVRELHPPPLAKQAKAVQGLIVGVGGLKPVPIPKLNAENRIIGYWQRHEVAVNRTGLRAGRAQSGKPAATVSQGGVYHSVLHETKLKQMAGVVGLEYHRLTRADGLSETLRSSERGDLQVVDSDARWLLSLIAVLLILSSYLFELTQRGALRTHRFEKIRHS